MAIFRTVEISPMKVPAEDPGEDAFIEASKAVCELFSEGLAEQRLEGRRSMLRIVPRLADDEWVVRITVNTVQPGPNEGAVALLPHGLERLSQSSQALLVLDVVHSATLRLAAARNWDPSAIQRAREHVLSRRLRDVSGNAVEDLSRPRVEVRGRGENAPEQEHEIAGIGGGPMNGVPRAYSDPLRELLHHIRSCGTEWWSTSEVKMLFLSYWFRDGDPKIAMGPGQFGLNVTIGRSLQSILESSEPAALARVDVEAALAAIAKRMKLGPPPTLPAFSTEVLAEAAAGDRRRELLAERILKFAEHMRPRLPEDIARQVDANLDPSLPGGATYGGALSMMSWGRVVREDPSSHKPFALAPEDQATLLELQDLVRREHL